MNSQIKYYLGSNLPKYIRKRAVYKNAAHIFADRIYIWNKVTKTLNVTSQEFSQEFLSN